MAKRFTDTNKYKKPFIRGLQGAYKLLWDYLYHDCDHAGIWIVDFDIAQIYIGEDMPVNKDDALKYFNSDEQRIIEICKGKKWFIPGFIDFQYNELNENNRAHQSVINILNKYNLFNDKGLVRPLQAHKVKDKDKDKDKDKEVFEKFWSYYNKKTNKARTLKLWSRLTKKEIEAIKVHLPKYIKATPDKQFRKDPATYLYNKSWNDEIIVKKDEKPKYDRPVKDVIKEEKRLNAIKVEKNKPYDASKFPEDTLIGSIARGNIRKGKPESIKDIIGTKK